MNYQAIYLRFIEDRRRREAALFAVGDYLERHHIVPKAIGGTDARTNLISISARDHYFAHCCLAKIHGGKMWSALFAVGAMQKGDPSARYFLRGRMIATARRMAALQRSVQMTELWGSGRFTRQREYGPMSAATKAAISAGNTGKKRSPESIAKTAATKRKAAKTYEFVHPESGRRLSGTQKDLIAQTGLSQALVSLLARERLISSKGWLLAGSNRREMRGRDPTIRRFKNKDGREFEGTSYEFRTVFGLDSGVISNLIHGKNGVKSFKGWFPASKGV